MKKLVLFLYLILASMVMSAQNTYEDNIRAAKKGDADAQFVIGSCYSTGANVEKMKRKLFIGGARRPNKDMRHLKAF
jgi:TPR repeat protein